MKKQRDGLRADNDNDSIIPDDMPAFSGDPNNQAHVTTFLWAQRAWMTKKYGHYALVTDEPCLGE